MPNTSYLLLLGVFLHVVCLTMAQNYPKVKFETFEMSKCPYCAAWKQNFETVVMQAQGVRDIIDLTEYFVAYYYDGSFSCLHGPGECVGDLFLLCAYNLTHITQPWAWWDLSVCMQAGQNYNNVPGNIEGCASSVGLNYNAINQCATGSLGTQLFIQSVDYCNSLGIDETPTSIINGQMYVGGSPNPLKAICSAYQGPLPPGCKNADTVPPFKVAGTSTYPH